MPLPFIFNRFILSSKYSFYIANFYNSAADNLSYSPSLLFNLLMIDYISKSSILLPGEFLIFFYFFSKSLWVSSFMVISFSLWILFFNSSIYTRMLITSWNIFSSVLTNTGCIDIGRYSCLFLTSLLLINCSIKDLTSELLCPYPLRYSWGDGASMNWPVGWLDWVRKGPWTLGGWI